MKLESISLTDFRGYKGTVVIPINEGMTGIVGRNDYGKSTILEALAIFFDTEGVKADKTDMNCFSLAEGADKYIIACEFSRLPASLILDENVETTLAGEFLLNSKGNLEIAKTFKAVTGKLDKTVICCNHPADAELSNLLGMKMVELKKLGTEKDISYLVADKRVASQWRKAIRDASMPLDLQSTALDVDKGFSTEGKSIWGKIQEQLPTFAIFKADRESSDGDAEAKNPLQQAVKDAQAALHSRIVELEQLIESSVLDVADRTLEKLREMAPELASELKPRFREKPKWTFNFTLDGENGIPINKRGSGVRRLILLNFFRAEAEKAVHGSERDVIYAIEEPETAQHPNYQIMLMKALLALSNRSNRQIIVTTHVPALAGLIPIEGIRFISKDAEGNPVVKLADNQTLKEAADSLGILPESGMERARGVVLVEGKSDVTFLRHAASALKEAGHIRFDLEDVGIAPILIGGCGSVKHWVTLRLADNLGLPWCVFLDSDNGADPSQMKSIQKRKEEVEAQGRPFYATKKREIENYLCPDLIFSEAGVSVSFTDTCDAKKIIGSAVKMKPDDVLDRFWPLMTAERIIQRSLYQSERGERCEIRELLENILRLNS